MSVYSVLLSLMGSAYVWQSRVEIEHYSAARMSPALNGSTALQHFERGNAVEIHNGIMFNFYPGLPHM